MAIFLVIHGAWHGGWTFDRLRPLLESRGHAMIAPDLPGMGSGDATLNQWATFVADLAAAQPEPVILCGHSRGGIVISEAAERVPEAISALIYITAFLLPSGQSFLEEAQLYRRDPIFEGGLTIAPDGSSITISAEAGRAVFYNHTPAELAAAACDRMVAEPLAPAIVPLSLSADRFGRAPRVYIECSKDLALSPAHQRAMHQGMGCDRVVTLESDHSPFYSAPEALVDVLCNIAADLGTASLKAGSGHRTP